MTKDSSTSQNPDGVAPKVNPQTTALLAAIRKHSKEDPLVGAKVGANEVYLRLSEGMKNARGVHVESLLSALGALAGYACQASVRAQALSKGLSEEALLVKIETRDGRKYFFGDALNAALAESSYSVWSLAAAEAKDAGANVLPDLEEIFSHTSSGLGDEAFGVPRIPEDHKPNDLPLNYLRAFWQPLLPTVSLFCPNPVEWPVLYGIAIQKVIREGKNVIDPGLALQIVMESAVPMSKVQLRAETPKAVHRSSKNPKAQQFPVPQNWYNKLLKSRDGLIVLIATVIYTCIAVAVNSSKAVAAQMGFVGFFAPYMPVFILLMAYQIGLFRRNYRTDWINTTLLFVGALMPFLSMLWVFVSSYLKA